jgi:hypothetical protein
LPLDREALVAWSGSVSYLPRPGAPSHASMIAALDEAFEQHQDRGVVKLDFAAIGYCYALPLQ